MSNKQYTYGKCMSFEFDISQVMLLNDDKRHFSRISVSFVLAAQARKWEKEKRQEERRNASALRHKFVRCFFVKLSIFRGTFFAPIKAFRNCARSCFGGFSMAWLSFVDQRRSKK